MKSAINMTFFPLFVSATAEVRNSEVVVWRLPLWQLFDGLEPVYKKKGYLYIHSSHPNSFLEMKNAFLRLKLFLTAVAVVTARGQNSASRACRLLQSQLPGLVHFPGSTEYLDDISHFEASSTQNATCSVNPTCVEDVSSILKIVGRKDIRAPFAVKSGGHASNIGFSSTTGVQIAMSHFTDLVYDVAAQTVKIGSGLTWDQVYAKLSPFNVTVAGGRVPGVGVGLVFGGGYSWVADQYGLGVDNILAFDLVLPNGTFVEVTNSSYPDLFFGLKGGLNNFGIITTFTMNAHPLSSVWGGVITYSVDQKELVSQAIANFSLQNSDLKAQIAAAYVNSNGQAVWQVIMFYGEGTQPSLYQPFLNIPSISSNFSVRSLPDFLSTIDVVQTNSGGLSNMIPILKYTLPILNEIQTQIDLTYSQAVKDNRSVIAVLLGVEPFLDAFGHSTPSAYPHPASRQVTPCNPWITFSDVADAQYFHDALWNMSNTIQAFAIQQGQSLADDIHYPNYALGDTPLELLYGDNLQKLREIKAAADPQNVMGLTGGYKF